jgi:hypothetical protein
LVTISREKLQHLSQKEENEGNDCGCNQKVGPFTLIGPVDHGFG